MNETAPQRFDVLVVGAGPAGMAASVTAAECGARVGVMDDNVAAGGQIWRGNLEDPEANSWSGRLRAKGVVTLFGTRVFDQPAPGCLLAERADDTVELHYEKLILATGARERFLPFPGWTLPSVMGAGGLQAMVKSGLPVQGKRVVVAGTGPLLLAVAVYLRKQGAEISLICEQASWSRLARFGMGLLRFRKKIGEGLLLRKDLAGIPFAANSWPTAAHGTGNIESVTVLRGGRTLEIACDYLACGFHLVPNLELPLLLGCKLADGFVQVDELQQTSLPNVFCAGEPTGIGGVEKATAEGSIAGFAACGKQASEKDELLRARKEGKQFASLLKNTFALRLELRNLPTFDTIVCRCEDVTFSRLHRNRSWREAKLHTRCGMGACQGRVCGPVTQFLFGWNPDSVRPPVFPVRVESLAALSKPASR
ncbi:MAG TPA: FAD/NAD(P)-binding oxidoreductase [Dongiaceae bacterium]|nr:FAD/NAD(P)-binding oxidoreductase [Dongiaceae bacterium]